MTAADGNSTLSAPRRRAAASSQRRRVAFAGLGPGLLTLLILPFFVDVVARDAPQAKAGVVDFTRWGPLKAPVPLGGDWTLSSRGGGGGVGGGRGRPPAGAAGRRRSSRALVEPAGGPSEAAGDRRGQLPPKDRGPAGRALPPLSAAPVRGDGGGRERPGDLPARRARGDQGDDAVFRAL